MRNTTEPQTKLERQLGSSLSPRIGDYSENLKRQYFFFTKFFIFCWLGDRKPRRNRKKFVICAQEEKKSLMSRENCVQRFSDGSYPSILGPFSSHRVFQSRLVQASFSIPSRTSISLSLLQRWHMERIRSYSEQRRSCSDHFCSA